jgi:hypothetical protein
MFYIAVEPCPFENKYIVAGGVRSPEFKPQYCQKKKKKRK